MKLIMTKGLPASGKTNWAKAFQEEFAAQGWVRVNKDDLRAMVHAGRWSGSKEKFIIKLRDNLIIQAFDEKKNIIVDDTNFAPEHEKRLRELCEQYGAHFEIRDFTDVPVEVCIERNRGRANPVPDKAIYQMYQQYLRVKPDQQEYIMGLPEAVIVDIDGTLATHEHRGHYDYDKVSADCPVDIIIDIVRMFDRNGQKIIIVSGRDDRCSFDTIKWLDRHMVPFTSVHMRKTGDTRLDSIIKREIFDNHIKGKYNVRCVLDDRNQVVSMWRGLGLKCLQVEEGNF